MEIWLTKLSGQLDLINALNHYIGMRPIHQENFPELNLMPWLILGLIGLGLLVVLFNRRWLLGIWVIVFGLLIAIGLVDFYRWGYEYGHNLDPRAPIKVPGMAYQPPLIGSKRLLNFVAHSYPAAGGLIAFGSFVIGTVMLTAECLHARRQKRRCMDIGWKSRVPVTVP